MRRLPLTLLCLALLLPDFSYADETSAAAQAREQRKARIQERVDEWWKKENARIDASVKEGEEFMEATREANADAIAEGMEAAEAYAQNNPVDGFPNTEVRVQETWVWDEALGDQRLEWQYRLVYKDSLGNAQYEAYFDYQGNVTTALRESPWRVANQAVDRAMGEDSEGPYQVAWSFSEDNEGREYPATVIVQASGQLNRVQMKFNENGDAYFWDVKDADGEQVSYGHGTQTPTFADEGSPLGSVNPPRPATGTCEKCRALLEKRNDFLVAMVPLANRINDLAGQHTRLNEFARNEQAHVQDFGRLRALHEFNMSRYRALEDKFKTADAAWRACQETCPKPAAGSSSPALNAIGSPIGIKVLQDSTKQCTFGDPNGPSTTQAMPSGSTPGAAPNSSTNSGGSDSGGGNTAQNPSSGQPADGEESNGEEVPSYSGSDDGGSPTYGPDKINDGSSEEESAAANDSSKPGEDEGESGVLHHPLVNYVPIDEGEASENEDESPEEEKEEPSSTPALLIIKASTATMTKGATVSGQSSQLVGLQPQSINDVALPTDSCGTSDCDWWKMEDSCGESWVCEEDTNTACNGDACDDYDLNDCSDASCGWDVGYDQNPVKCVTGSDGQCSLEIDAMQQRAGSYYVVVDGFSAQDAPSHYTLDVNVIDSEGITIESEGGDLSALPPQYQHYVQDSVTVGDNTWHTMLYPTEEAADVREALALISGLGIIAIDPCWIKWKTPNDPYYHSSNTWEQGYADQWALHKIGFPPKGENAWDQLDEGAAEVTVAIIDTGIDWNHRDIAWRNLWLNTKEIADNGKDDDGNGYIDDRLGWDFWEGDNRPWDEDGHGTLLAGIIAARSDNNTGIAGINPKARIMPLRALNAFGHTRASYVAKALVYAVDNGAKVVNLSVGGPGESAAFRAAVDYAESRGVLIVAAAGNEAAELTDILPGAHDAVLTVAALDTQDARAAFSNYGPEVDIAAPGVDILSLRARFTDTMLGLGDIEYAPGQATVGSDKRYYRVGGTSFASPFVTGVASLLLSKDPSLKASDLRRILAHSAADVAEPGWDQLTGYGRVDALAALKADKHYFIEARIQGFNVEQRKDGTVVVVQGTADANAFKAAEVMLGLGDNPDRWRRLNTLKGSVGDGELAAIPAAAFAAPQGSPKNFTVRLIVKHKDGSSREVRFGLELG